MGVCQHAGYVSVIAASGNASGMHRVCIRHASGYGSSDHPSVKVGEGDFGARPYSQFSKVNLERCAQPLGDLNFTMAF